MKEGFKRTCCPCCGGKILVSAFYTSYIDYPVLKSGKLGSRGKKHFDDSSDCDSMLAECLDCDACWGEDDFYVDNDGCFIDLKYDKET